MHSPLPGQRWISPSEPALGLGLIRDTEDGKVLVHFPAVDEKRLYSLDTSPLIRVRFNPGDTISDRDGRTMTVESVADENGLTIYQGNGFSLHEKDLLDSLQFIRPEKRLLAGLTDHPRDFDLRLQALGWNARLRQSPARGYTGARIDLIPHQLAIVSEAANRPNPRILLADEVGLGKTIEACLILHRLHLTGQASRILILVPESLVHQWFVELLRRFNLLFALFDEERCQSIEAHDAETNPFLDSQLILAATDFLTRFPERAEQAKQAGFDLLIVDEAHHLEWSPEAASPAYQTIESLAREAPALLLLTATPQQLGPAGHFARLRLLDPDRYSDLEAFLAETHRYAPLAEAVEALKSGKTPDSIASFTARSPRAAAHFDALRKGDEPARTALVSELIDSFGTGRVLFRNTRERLTGFPRRIPHLHPLPPGHSPYVWLAELLRELPENEKVLLITSSPEAALTVQEKLLEQIHVESALFHEDLSLLQRDRHAAWFADPEGARILICSEIGSEGRNFQFARHLVLFGLPRDPELLEQRIGRLDRIGQTGDIHIHVPFGVGSASERHARWLHEGLDAFTAPLKGATTLAATLLPELEAMDEETDFSAFLERSRDLKKEILIELNTGHDRLLELGAPAPEKAEGLRQAIVAADSDTRFEKFVVTLFDHLGLDVSDLSTRSYHFHRGQRQSEAFADLQEEGLSATFDRSTALSREDLAFLTPDHPIFRGALDHLLDGNTGNAAFAHWKTGQGKGLLLECAFVLECIAPTRLHLDRFLPPTLLRVVVDHKGTPFTENLPTALLQPGDARRLIQQDTFRRELFPGMLDAARKLAETTALQPANAAHTLANTTLTAEIDRLHDLASRNPQVSHEEICALEIQREQSLAALLAPRLRLDSLRLIWRS
ncbi:MAG: SNF2-related protein [Luteolibacter sp.]